MISVKILAKQVEKLVVDNSPVILTAVGVVGSVSAVVLTGKATVNAVAMVTNEEMRLFHTTPAEAGDVKLSNTEIVKLVWKEYIPAAGVLGVTVSSIVFATRINTRRAAAMAAAYSLSEKAYGEYREKVVEKFNANKERQVKDEIAQDRVNANPPKDAQIIITGNGDVTCYDLPTGRYFKSNMEKLRSVQNTINAQVCEVGYATLSDFYVALNLKETPYSEELGWTTDKLMDIHFSAVMTEDNVPCISIDYQAQPIRGITPHEGGCMDDPPF